MPFKAGFGIFLCFLISVSPVSAYTHADTLRGSNGRGRAWWDVQKYDLHIYFDTATQSISGYNVISFDIVGHPLDSMQVDLQEPMQVDSVFLEEEYYLRGSVEAMKDTFIYSRLQYLKDGNVWWVMFDRHKWDTADASNLRERKVAVCYHGSPRRAVRPPWDGGFTWTRDSLGRPWIAVSCQGLGASVWWPCKDAQWDKPDRGMDFHFKAPRGMQVISNGRLDTVVSAEYSGDYTNWYWRVDNPINTYDATFYIGDYVHWHDTLAGESGPLDLDFYALSYNEQRARQQFAVVKPMIHCFEYWLGPYPFYSDGYKLVEAPYLGMEHQSAVAYGNEYQMGYKGRDRSGTGIGLKFDFIIIHESGHEWFGNSVTATDIADNWIHEGITTYFESLFAECMWGKEAGKTYDIGAWHNIQNDKPMIGDYGVNIENTGDIYNKGAAVMHMIREMTGNDSIFRLMLRGLGKEFRYQAVTTRQVEHFISAHTNLQLDAFFNQYLRHSQIPELEYSIKENIFRYRFVNTVTGFTIPLPASSGKRHWRLKPTTAWQQQPCKGCKEILFSKDFLVDIHRVK